MNPNVRIRQITKGDVISGDSIKKMNIEILALMSTALLDNCTGYNEHKLSTDIIHNCHSGTSNTPTRTNTRVLV